MPRLLFLFVCLFFVGCSTAKIEDPGAWHEQRIKEIREAFDDALITQEEYDRLMEEVDTKVEKDNKK